MHTAHFQFQLPPLDVTLGGWIGPKMNKFEQVSSGHHQMSLAGAWAEGWVCHPGDGALGYVQRGGGQGVASPIWAIPWCIWCTYSPVDRMTDTCENITFPQLCW